MTPSRPVLAAALAASLAAACASTASPPAATAPTATEQFAIQVRLAPDEIQLAPHGALSPTQDQALADLVMRWREKGHGDIVIQAQGAGPGASTAQAAAAALQRYGVPANSIRSAPFEAATPSPVRVGFNAFEALGPQCAGLWDDVVRTASNQPAATFGCATTSNLAAQIANAEDLLAPAAAPAADSRRRVSQLNTYVGGGQPTTSSSQSQGANP